ncbi:MAG: ion transporter [Candidatus Woesearchaeota archaeon]|nr:ion transporter [Candidatus Woesearchaeota archaeon]
MNTYDSTKKRTFEILERSRFGDVTSRAVDAFILSLIILNILALILETMEALSHYATFFHYFELFSIIVFSIEYILRIWSCVSVKKYERPILGRLRFAVTPLAIIDLLAVVPAYLPYLLGNEWMALRAIRLFRLLRLLKLGGYTSSLSVMERVFKTKKEEILMSISIMLVLILTVSSLMYFVENTAQPEVFSSIPATMWWAVATVTTVGYGDVYPITPVGRLLGGIVAILGIGMFALPTAVLGAAFTQEAEMRKRKKAGGCPHCGK